MKFRAIINQKREAEKFIHELKMGVDTLKFIRIKLTDQLEEDLLNYVRETYPYIRNIIPSENKYYLFNIKGFFKSNSMTINVVLLPVIQIDFDESDYDRFANLNINKVSGLRDEEIDITTENLMGLSDFKLIYLNRMKDFKSSKYCIFQFINNNLNNDNI